MTDVHVNLPRVAGEIRMGEGAGFYQLACAHPVKSDEMAADVLAVVAHIENRKTRIKQYCDEQIARLDYYAERLKDSPAWLSLSEYVKAHPNKGKKTLELPEGTVKITKRKNVLTVHDAKAVLEAHPELGYEYVPPVTRKLSKENLRKHMEAEGAKSMVADTASGYNVVATLQPEVETVSVKPNEAGLIANADMPQIRGEDFESLWNETLALIEQRGEEDEE